MARNFRQLPVVIDIPKPCAADWQAMQGDGHVRHCARCDKDVHLLTELSEARIASLLERGACLRFQVTADGAVVHGDRKGNRAARVVATAALAALAACGEHVGGDPVPVASASSVPAPIASIASIAPIASALAPTPPVAPPPRALEGPRHLMGAPPIRPVHEPARRQ